MATSNFSSYQKGIDRLLQNQEKFERLIIEYLLSVNSRYNSNMFPTTQIGKVLLNQLKLKKTQFPIIHKIVRTIFKQWNEHGWCDYVSTTKSGRNRRTKYIYKFSPEQFKFLKGHFISSSISEIENEMNDSKNIPMADAMRARETILDDWLEKFQDMLDEIDVSQAEEEDQIDPDEITEET